MTSMKINGAPDEEDSDAENRIANKLPTSPQTIIHSQAASNKNSHYFFPFFLDSLDRIPLVISVILDTSILFVFYLNLLFGHFLRGLTGGNQRFH